MPTLLNDSATVDDYDTIGSLDCTQSVCNDDHSSIFQIGIYRLLNLSTVKIMVCIYTVDVFISYIFLITNIKSCRSANNPISI